MRQRTFKPGLATRRSVVTVVTLALGREIRWLQTQHKHLRLAMTGATTLFIVVAMAGIGSVLTAGSASAATTTARIALPSSAADPQYGVLLADSNRANTDHTAGVRLEMMDVSWASWEPTRGTFSSSYEAQELARVNQFRQLGDTVGINLSLSVAPAWALALPNSQLVDQHGKASGTLNYEFSAAVQSLTATYVKSAVAKLGRVSYYTLGASYTSEALYPTTTTDQWWAFGSIAQGKTSGMATGVGTNPMSGWVPGTSTWNNHTVTDAQVQSWYKWYIGALANFIGWERTVITNAGYNGYFELGWPGTGTNPWVYNYRLTTHLAATSDDAYDTMNSGSVYQVLLDDLPSLNGMVIDVSSVGDGSGTPADNACRASDASVNYLTDSAVDSWSSVRWLSYLARRHGLPIIGESTGSNTAAQMAADFALVRSCGLIGLQWAFDYELYSGGYATIANYATRIRDARAAAPATLAAGRRLTGGHDLTSTNGRYKLDMQRSNGNLVLYKGSKVLWTARTAGHSGDYLILKSDGNLVVSTRTGKTLWAARTAGHVGDHLILKSDGNLVVSTRAGKRLWASNTQ